MAKPTSASSILIRLATLMESSCSLEHKAIVQAVLKRAASAASAAAKVIRIGDARLFEYLFRTSDKSVRQLVNCPSYYKIMATSPNRGGKDQGLVAIHEMSHLKAVFTPATGDYAYGYNACIALDKENVIMNTDAHLYYAGGE